MVFFRLGPILVRHYNLVLAGGYIVALYIIYRAARRRDYNLERVMDWLIWGTFLLLIGGLLLGQTELYAGLSASLGRLLQEVSLQIPMFRKFFEWLYKYSWSLELGLLGFFLYTLLLFRRWRWRLFPPLNFLALGGSFLYMIVQVFFPNTTFWSMWWFRLFRVPHFLSDLLYFSALFYGLSRRFRQVGEGSGVWWVFLLFSLRPPLMVLGGMGLVVLKWEWICQKISLVVSIVQETCFQQVSRLRTIMVKDKNSDKQAEDLKKEQEELEKRIDDLEETAPENYPERVLENAPEEDAEEASEGARVGALRRMFRERLQDVKAALSKLRGGSYGVCDRCGAEIDPARLKAKPDARYCLDCAKELEG